MTASERNRSPDFFEEHTLDPVRTATRAAAASPQPKKKAGFYLTEALLARFNRRFHEMKLAGLPIENKSDLLEISLGFALDDLDRGENSRLLQTLHKTRANSG
ncbi:hypothetical protein [Desulfatitalea alkaliphila]|uniref:Uncharacterized protein n=1 Tax=Desulfatitalea alkaliphila TaxID=2929485 RepID=A0AA41R0G2_9BACT|nr:hypothetical protein [Desulfatitalea alkaliphila]MCJ8499954.1 hypothetical protein [Desulfatitalea alkaliphila]